MALQIRKHVYRNRQGFLICGRGRHSGIFGTQVFTEDRGCAERMRAKLNRGEHLTVQDWVPEPVDSHT